MFGGSLSIRSDLATRTNEASVAFPRSIFKQRFSANMHSLTWNLLFSLEFNPIAKLRIGFILLASIKFCSSL